MIDDNIPTAVFADRRPWRYERLVRARDLPAVRTPLLPPPTGDGVHGNVLRVHRRAAAEAGAGDGAAGDGLAGQPACWGVPRWMRWPA